MNPKQFIAAAAVFVAAGSAFAADATATAAAANTVAVASAEISAVAAAANVPSIQINKNTGRTRAEVRAEAVDFVKNYKSMFQIQLEQYKN